MSSPQTVSSQQPPNIPESKSHSDDFIESSHSRNMIVLGLYHIVLRVSWVFKTESVIIPTFLDTIAGAGWVRGFLPVLNRCGQSIPPLLFSERLRRAPRKKWLLAVTTCLMGIPFLILALMWSVLEVKQQMWLPPVFLVLYFIFFSVTGLNQLCFSTIQGKLIRIERRGRLLGISATVGAVASITCVWFLLGHWLKHANGGFDYIFGFTGLGFLIAGLICTATAEPAVAEENDGRASNNHFYNAWQTVREDSNFRRLAIVAMAFVTAQLLFPHYQALGRTQQGFELKDIMIWVISQNAGAAFFSLITGSVADRFGNRLAVRLAIFFAALTPLVALLLTGSLMADVSGFFWLTFVFLGLTPVTFRILFNYTLEICDSSKHPRYLSTLRLCMAVPFLLSPLVGLLIDLVGFEIVFVCIAGIITLGGLLTFRLSEPRLQSPRP